MPKRIFIEPSLNNIKDTAKIVFDSLKPSRNNFIFSKTILITPTKSSAKNLSTELAKLSMQSFGGGIAGIEVLTLDAFFSKSTSHLPTATETEKYFALNFTIKQFSNQDLPALFPNGIPSAPKNFFKKFLEIKTLCAQACLSINDATKKILESSNIETDRWLELEKFNDAYTSSLSKISKLDPADALLDALKNPFQIPTKIFLVGVADAPKILFNNLKNFEDKGAEITTIIFAKKTFSNFFNQLGVPDVDFWKEKMFDIPNANISVPQTRTIQAQQIASDISNLGVDAPLISSIACEEGESSATIKQALSLKNIKSFSPEGEKLSDGEIFDFLKSLKLYYISSDFDNLKNLLQKDALLSLIARKTELSSLQIFKIIDTYKFEKFAPNLDTAKELASAKTDQDATVLFNNLISILNPQAKFNSLKIAHILQDVFSSTKSFDPNIKDEAQNIANILSQIKLSEESFGEITMPETIELIIKTSDKRVFNKIHKQDEIQMKNWLEIFWANEPNIFIADFNDGQVPENISSDAFIPNSLREFLGIRSAKSRHARDAYFLHTILNSRKNSDVKIYVPKTDFDGEPLRPSRLLLQTEKAELVERANLLFADAQSDKHSRAFTHSWQMNVPNAPLPQYLNATDFKYYLTCPFEFYLKRILKLNSIDTKKCELDALDIGTITHKALEILVKEDKDTTNENEIFAILKENVDGIFKSAYGKNLPTALSLQKYFIISKFVVVAKIEAEHRKNGWRTIFAEKTLQELSSAGFNIKAKIDRIDFNEAEQKYLLIDYKTIDSAYKDITTSNHFVENKKTNFFRWIDLQLPIYIASAKKFFHSENVDAAYFLITKSADETRIETYKNSKDVEEKASQVIEDIATNIRNYNFKPSEKYSLEKDYPEYFGFVARNLEKFLDLSAIGGDL